MRSLLTLFRPINRPHPALLSEVARDFPQIGRWNIGDLEKANFLRRWAYLHVRRGLSADCLLDADDDFGYYNKDVPEIFEAFASELGGVWCGGTAHALMMLYRHFGFVSHSIDMGVAATADFPGITHVNNLVEIRHRGRLLLLVQDGYFNLSYVDRSSGEPLDYFELLTRLVRREHDRIAMVWPGAENTACGLTKPGSPPAPQISWALNDRGPRPEATASGLLKQPLEFTFDLFASRYDNFRAFKAMLISKGYPPEPIYLLLFPFAVYGKDPHGDAILQRARSIVSSQ